MKLDGRVIVGLIVIAVGTSLLLQRGEWGLYFNVPIWPAVLVFLGLARLGDRRVDAAGRVRFNRTGAWLIFLGFWGFINEYRLFGLHYGNSWPVIVIGAGALMVWHAVDPLSCSRRQKPSNAP